MSVAMVALPGIPGASRYMGHGVGYCYLLI